MLKQLSYILLVTLFLSNCARVGRPTGGPKDEKPPITISASPDFNTIHFNSDKIKIYFDEYIKLKDVTKQLVISPPLKYYPEITPLGSASKFITIKIKDTLVENTTYVVNFGNAIVDNSEGNTLQQFKYLFSTGSYIDSLMVNGSVQDAFNKETASNIFVMLYHVDSLYNDSVIYSKKPNYIASTLDSTTFSITNIKEGKYRLIALEDANKNMKYDPSQDKIAFQDDFISVPADTSFNLSLFREIPNFSIKNHFELSKNHFVIGYEGELDDAKMIDLVDKENKKIAFVSYKDLETDSLHIWHKPTVTDSMFVSLKRKDSIFDVIVKHRSKEVDSLAIALNVSGILHLKDTLFVLSNIPIDSVDVSKIQLMGKDSAFVPLKIIKNKFPNKIGLQFDKKIKERYFLTLFPEAVTDYLGMKNDTLKYSFSTKKPEDYGEFSLNVDLKTQTPVIIELIDNKSKVLAVNYVNTSQTIKYQLLKPAKYGIRAIFDRNDNKKWDTGNFMDKIQPERVVYFPKEIEIRANWSNSEDFILK